jgi:hypothetical protein
MAQAVRHPREIAALTHRDRDRWLLEPDVERWPWWPVYFDNFANAANRRYYAYPYVPPQ